MALANQPPIPNHIFVVPRKALRYVCGPNNINLTKLPALCGANAFIDPNQLIAGHRLVRITLNGPPECQIKALGELSYCLMRFNSRIQPLRPASRAQPYERAPDRRLRRDRQDDEDPADGEIVEVPNSDPY
tara:strand:+ start:114 stop:506 length:393 start_codon:yes stop_codon:yes gene_type:complete